MALERVYEGGVWNTQVDPGGGGGGSLPALWTDGGNGDVTAAAEPTFVPLTIEASDINTAALLLKPAPGGTATGNALLDVEDDTGARIFDIDAAGTVAWKGAPHQRVSIGHIGQMHINAVAAEFDGPTDAVFEAKVDSGFSSLKLSLPSQPFAATISAQAEAQVALSVSSDAADADGVDIIQGAGAPDYNGREFRVLAGGAIATAQHTAPADANLNAGECAIWFDQTNGAAKLKIKGKSANGTVVVGEVALT